MYSILNINFPLFTYDCLPFFNIYKSWENYEPPCIFTVNFSNSQLVTNLVSHVLSQLFSGNLVFKFLGLDEITWRASVDKAIL